MPSSKTALETLIDNDITTNGTGDITGAKVNNVLKDIVESYQDVIQQLDTTAINALTPTLNQIVFNTDTNYLMQYNGSLWVSLVAVLIGNTAAINASTPKEGQLFYNTTTKTLSFGDGVTHVGVQTDECTCVKTVKVTLSSAQILNSNTTPVELIPAPGVEKVLLIHDMVVRYPDSTTPYATNTNGIVKYSSSSTSLFSSNIDLTDVLSDCEVFNANKDSEKIAVNDSLIFTTETGNPTAGNGEFVIILTYQIITL